MVRKTAPAKTAKTRAPAKKPAATRAAPSKARTTRAPAPAPTPAGLSEVEHRFLLEYLADLNATQAYLRVCPGVTVGSARTMAARLLAKVDVQDAIAAAKAKRVERTEITADKALQEVWNIATADPRELVEYRVGCCRYCWGKDHRYQRTAAELARDKAAHEAARRADPKKAAAKFDVQGGDGYLRARGPNADCPECSGEGEGRTVFHDTRTVSPAAASLFAGVKETKEGLEIKIHSKDAALDKVLRHLGLFEKDNRQKSPLDGLPRETLKAIVARLSGG